MATNAAAPPPPPPPPPGDNNKKKKDGWWTRIKKDKRRRKKARRVRINALFNAMMRQYNAAVSTLAVRSHSRESKSDVHRELQPDIFCREAQSKLPGRGP
ncbi:hypothetical protein N7457_008293 [Penicillium paradoxum]|uniref:uncharacterized protein n=1 Tax=Penicillium paradoxum TaxID=176176 RepID=UPI0025468CDB|nr:uncharacterized protein N7457_008293 [Penicillium paradoxum]KAJ5773397.1 hypothetical protein N7457_008293 [Penicillium paradoxum]